MIVVRMVFNVRMDSSVQEVVDSFKKNVDMFRDKTGSEIKMRILTDLSGPFNTVVQEMELESLAAWEQFRTALFSNPDFQEERDNEPTSIETGSAPTFESCITISASDEQSKSGEKDGNPSGSESNEHGKDGKPPGSESNEHGKDGKPPGSESNEHGEGKGRRSLFMGCI